MATADPDAVRAYYDYVDAEDYEAVFELFAADVTYERPGRPRIPGLDGFREFYLDDRSVDGEHELRAVLADGDTVAVRGRFSGDQDGTRCRSGSRTSTDSTNGVGFRRGERRRQSAAAGPLWRVTRLVAHGE